MQIKLSYYRKLSKEEKDKALSVLVTEAMKPPTLETLKIYLDKIKEMEKSVGYQYHEVIDGMNNQTIQETFEICSFLIKTSPLKQYAEHFDLQFDKNIVNNLEKLLKHQAFL